tara:strand:+ start:381 stop:563 length:183 start_codon:yes stop_codon:yes gene_type:complete
MLNLNEILYIDLFPSIISSIVCDNLFKNKKEKTDNNGLVLTKTRVRTEKIRIKLDLFNAF